MSLVTPAEVRALVQTGLGDSDLQAVIDRVEFEIEQKFGAAYVDGSTTETVIVRGGDRSLYLNRRIGSVTSISEASLSGSATTVDDSQYVVWGNGGRIQRVSGYWGEVCTVVFVPQDDNDLRASVIISLVKLELQRTPFQSESIAGEYSYTVGDQANWELERKRLFGRLNIVSV